MTETLASGEARPAGTTSAGQLLREARLAHGLHIAALASAIKVTPRKLEALEADRFDELPDATFTRALAQTVCRTLKIDPAPVLALLPPSRSHRLEKAGPGLNTRLRERPAPLQPGGGGRLSRIAIWGPALIALAALAIYVMPTGWLPVLTPRDGAPAEPDSSASAPLAVFPPATLVVEPGAPVEIRAPSELASSASGGGAPSVAEPGAPGSAAASTDLRAATAVTTPSTDGAAAAATPLLRVQASADSWVSVVDARGQTLLGRTVKAGETLALDGTAPLRVRVGNASATALVFRGEAVALERHSRGNLATVELK